MKTKLSKFFSESELEQLFVLHWGHFFPTLFADLLYAHRVSAFPWFTFIYLLVYFLSYKALRSLYYSFWTFAFILFLYNFFSLALCLWNPKLQSVGYFYALSLVLLLSELYGLFGPIYYPLVNWWEYDFRFRADLKVLAVLPDHAMVEGRLTDLRRSAGCVVLFDELSVGDMISIKTTGENHELRLIELKAQVMSKRSPLPGRGNHYGVKFHFTKDVDHNAFRDFSAYWKRKRGLKMRMKLQKDS